MRAVEHILHDHLGVTPAHESHAPFLIGDHLDYKMDTTVHAGAFPTAALTQQHLQKAQGYDVSIIEIQAAANLRKAATDPTSVCTDRQLAKQRHYRGQYDGSTWHFNTIAIGTFGNLGDEARRVVDSIATESAARKAVATGDQANVRLKGILASRIRGALSVALHAALSDRVVAYMTAPQHDWMLLEDRDERLAGLDQ